MRYWIYSVIYIIAWSLVSVTQVSAQVDRYNCLLFPAPVNDICSDAIDIGNTVEGVTCCGNVEGVDQCGNMETSVWFKYDQVDDATKFDFINVDINGHIGIEIYTGDCNDLMLLEKSECGGFDTISFTITNCVGPLFVHVLSRNEGCGTFIINTEEITGCNAAEDCEDVTSLHTISPISDQGQQCISSCLNFSCNSNCADQSVWLRVNTDDNASALQIELDNALFDPIIKIYRQNISCDNAVEIIDCTPIGEADILKLDVLENASYLIEISSDGGTPSAFDLCVNSLDNNVNCASGTISVRRPENPTANPDGPFCPGETVEFCYEMEFAVDPVGTGNSCMAPQGIIPVLGGGWDLTANNISNQEPTGWTYWRERSVDYNLSHPSLGLNTDPNGKLILEYGDGGLSSGDLLPEGWWFVSDGNSGCTNDGDPDNGWGMITTCDETIRVNHCFSLTTRRVSDVAECEEEFDRDLSVTIFTFADGETGCYSNTACTGDTPATFHSEMDCSTLYNLRAQDKDICSGDFIDVPVFVVGGFVVPVFVEPVITTGTTGSQQWLFNDGTGVIPDQIINLTDEPVQITYAVSYFNPESNCSSPAIFFDVLVQPEIDFGIQDGNICDGQPVTISAADGMDVYEWYSLDNSLLSETNELEVTEPGVYVLQVMSGLCTDQVEVTVEEDNSITEALIQDSIFVCNQDIGALPTTFDLSSIVISGVEGIWYDDMGNEVLDPTSVDFAGNNEGVLEYLFETTSIIAPCLNIQDQIYIKVENCICPDVVIDAIPDLCAEDQILDLNDYLNTTDSGEWNIFDGPDVTSLSLVGSEIRLHQNIVPGVYTCAFKVNQSGFHSNCTFDFPIEFKVVQPPSAQVVSEITVCNKVDGIHDYLVGLDTLYLNGDAGEWRVDNPLLSIENNEINFVDILPGEYFLTYTTNVAEEPCQDSSYTTTVKVIDCSCPDLSLNNPEPLCNEGGILDLNTLLTPETVEGTWSFLIGPETLIIDANDMLDVSGMPDGLYTLEYTPVDMPNSFCQQSTTIEIQVFSPLSAGTGNVINFCASEQNTIDLFLLLDNAETGGVWSETSTSLSLGGFDNESGTFTLDNEEAGIYEFTYTQLSSASCPGTSAKVLVVLNSQPNADAGIDTELTCSQNTVTLGGPDMASGARIIYEWSESSGQIIPNSDTPNPIVTQPGIYVVRVSDSLFGCESVDSVVISEDRSIPLFDYGILPVDCTGNTPGGIEIFNSSGGNGDYEYSFDGGLTWTNRTLQDTLAPGLYDVSIRDGNGCESSVEGIEVPGPINIGLDIGEDREVQFGDFTVVLNLTTIASAEDINIVVWEENGEVLCEGQHDDCYEIEVDPDGVVTYCVTVTDDNGCEESACIVLTEVVDPNLYMANVFSPIEEGINNTYFVQSDEYITEVKEFFIMNKWGDMVYYSQNHPPNDPAYGWDGKFKGKLVPSGVYAYYVRTVDVIGEELKSAGDLTLLR